MRQMFCTVLLICCVFILSCSDTEHSIDIAEETLHVAKTEKIPYDTYISESLAGNKHALEEIFHCSHHFDAAAAIGHGLVLYEIRQHDQMFFDSVLQNEDAEVKSLVQRLLKTGEAYQQ